MPNHFPIILPVLMPVLMIASGMCSAQSVLRVDDDALSGGDGQAWASAYDNLQSALGAATSGDEIWIAQGLYMPSDGDATMSFVMLDGVSIYGGFMGNETARDQRDPATNITRLSGDVGRDDTFDPYMLNTANAGHVVVASGVGSGTVIDGVTIEYGAYGPSGTGAGNPLMFGSGIYCISGSPTINNCVIQFNYTAFAAGGGMYFLNAHPAITNTTVQYNSGHLSNGAGIFLGGSSGAVIEDCAIRYNTVVFSSPDGYGGGISHDSDGELIVRRSIFEGNLVRPFFSLGDNVGYGGGIFSFRSPLTVEDSVFKNNTASIGGGIIAWNEALIVNTIFENNTAQAREGTIQELGGFGGGFCSYSFQQRDMYLENCTFVNNDGKEHGGASGGWNSNLIVNNCIFFGNTGWNPEFQGYYREHIGGSFDLRYSLIPGIFGPPAEGEDPIDAENLPGCIEANPMFVSTTDFRLSANSPAIDAGENAGWTSILMTDFDGNPRFVDDPNTPDTGAGPSPVIDMGAYEFQVTASCPADITGDGQLNFFDVSAFLSAFAANDLIADFTGDGQFNFFDVSAFLSAFAAGCP